MEASVEFGDRHLSLSSFEDGAALELPQAGWHRVRYCASKMDVGREIDTTAGDEATPDRYLIQLWPAPSSPDKVVKVGSETAAYWHGVTTNPAP